MIGYDFEVFKFDWLVVAMDMDAEKEIVIENDPDALKALYEAHVNDIWFGFNNKHYDQYIMKAILLGMDPKWVNDQIIVHHKEGWQLNSEFNRIPMINYDVMTSTGMVGLKTLEGFMGSDIRETSVPFNVNRKLTREELDRTIFYCRHDVEETVKVFLEKMDDFDAMFGIVSTYDDILPFSAIGDTAAGITAKVMECDRDNIVNDDEFDFPILDCIEIKKYSHVIDWFKSKRGYKPKDDKDKALYYKQEYTTIVAGVPHTFGFGGLHGAPDEPLHLTPKDGAGYHVDVNNYYPSLVIAHGLTPRSATNDNYPKMYMTRKQLKMKQQAAAMAGNKAEAKMYKKMQLPYKKMLNALSGAMKDKHKTAYDPRNNNAMCINGQLMLLDLIEHLEVIDGFILVQLNERMAEVKPLLPYQGCHTA